MPFTFIASIFLIIAFFPIQQVTDFITMVLRTEDASVWQEKLLYVNNATLAIGGLLVVIPSQNHWQKNLKQMFCNVS